MEFALSDKSPVLGVFGVNPTREMVSGLDQEELAVGIVNLNGE